MVFKKRRAVAQLHRQQLKKVEKTEHIAEDVVCGHESILVENVAVEQPEDMAEETEPETENYDQLNESSVWGEEGTISEEFMEWEEQDPDLDLDGDQDVDR